MPFSQCYFKDLSMDKEYVQIETLGLQHFCIRNKNPIEELKRTFIISNLSDRQTVNKIDWEFIHNGNKDSKKFILLTDLNDWSYILWSYWDFNLNIDFAKDLSQILSTKVNYYFIDSYIATSRWVFANEGQIERAYFESHGEKLFDFGFNEIENNLRQTIPETFVEDIYWDLYEKTCRSLEYVNRQKIKEIKLYTGTFGDRKENS